MTDPNERTVNLGPQLRLHELQQAYDRRVRRRLLWWGLMVFSAGAGIAWSLLR